ncbi:MAG TPA: Omp28-related outer membrane protein, partial [Puia sp.]|nr:Omp28-related outer membrane protein [Puia sp.]
NYIFDDVFRGCINSPGTISGQAITTPATITGHTPINYTFNGFQVSSNFNDANCKIIAVLINNADRGVLQAAECNLQ